MARLGIFDPDLRAAALPDEGLVAEGNFDPDFIGPPAGGGASGPTTRPSVVSQAFRRARRVFMGAVIVLHAPVIPPAVPAKAVAPVVVSQAIPRASSWRRHDRNSSHVVLARTPAAQIYAKAVPPTIVLARRHRGPGSVHFSWNSGNPNPILTTPKPIVVLSRTHRPQRGVVFVRTALAAPSPPQPKVVQARTHRPRGGVVFVRAPQSAAAAPSAVQPIPVVITSQSRARASTPQYRRALVSFDWNSGNANPILAASRAPTVVLAKTHRLRGSVIVSRAPQPAAAVIASPAPEPVIVRSQSRRAKGSVLFVRAPQAAAVVVASSAPEPVVVRAAARRQRGGSALFIRASQPPAPPAKPVVVLARARAPRHVGILSLRTAAAQVYLKAPPIVVASQTPIRAARRPRGGSIVLRTAPPPAIVVYTKAAPFTVVLQAVRTSRLRHTATPLRITFDQAPIIVAPVPIVEGPGQGGTGGGTTGKRVRNRWRRAVVKPVPWIKKVPWGD